MTDKEKLDKLIAEIKRRIAFFYEQSVRKITTDYNYCALALQGVLCFYDSLQEEPVSSVWHDANQQPKIFRKYLVRYSDGRVSGSWERHDDGFIPWKDVVKEHGFTHWCYVEDLLKL